MGLAGRKANANLVAPVANGKQSKETRRTIGGGSGGGPTAACDDDE